MAGDNNQMVYLDISCPLLSSMPKKSAGVTCLGGMDRDCDTDKQPMNGTSPAVSANKQTPSRIRPLSSLTCWDGLILFSQGQVTKGPEIFTSSLQHTPLRLMTTRLPPYRSTGSKRTLEVVAPQPQLVNKLDSINEGFIFSCIGQNSRIALWHS